MESKIPSQTLLRVMPTFRCLPAFRANYSTVAELGLAPSVVPWMGFD